MGIDQLKGRRLKKKVLDLLESKSFEAAMVDLLSVPPRRVVNPLFSLLYHSDLNIRWYAVSAMGQVVTAQAAADMESARIVMRRLIWNLNDESGGIGWGSPEAMGEIMALCSDLAAEYGNMLISYVHPEGNFLEHEILQQGVLWGIGRLSHARPNLMQSAACLLVPFLTVADPYRRGLAAWAVGPLAAAEAKPILETISNDPAAMTLYQDYKLVELTVGTLAKGALRYFVTS